MEKKNGIRFVNHLVFNIFLSLVLIAVLILEIIKRDELCPLIMIPLIVILFLVVLFSWLTYISKIMKDKNGVISLKF